MSTSPVGVVHKRVGNVHKRVRTVHKPVGTVHKVVGTVHKPCGRCPHAVTQTLPVATHDHKARVLR
jgi:hypothetical protein